MMNTGKLAGKTLFITGGTRGIGKEIAMKAAKDGANIVIAAKTVNPHPKLPGTLSSVSKEIEAAGGKALPCVCDIRSDEQVIDAVEKAVKTFGGIDILVNNASAISITGTLETDMKRYDLMHNINARGTYLVSKTCHPHLKKSSHAHILTMSPPMNMNQLWFESHLAYTMAKYGMSMCVLGMSAEFKRDGIAVNALWPKTMIQTAATAMLLGDFNEGTRLPQIMADSAYVILSRSPKEATGQFFIDEDVLKDSGMTDEDILKYSTIPGSTELNPDVFMDVDASGKILTPSPIQTIWTPIRKMSTFVANRAFYTQKRKMSSEGTSSVEALFTSINSKLNDELVKKNQAVIQFNIISGDKEDSYFIDLKNGSGSAGKGAPKDKPDATFTLKSENFNKMVEGKLKAQTAFMTGKLKISGNLQKAMKLDKALTSLIGKQ